MASINTWQGERLFAVVGILFLLTDETVAKIDFPLPGWNYAAYLIGQLCRLYSDNKT